MRQFNTKQTNEQTNNIKSAILGKFYLFGVYQMSTEVCSPINRKSNAVPLSPGAKSNPSRASADAATARHSEPEPMQKEADARRSKNPAPSLPTDE
jgi:hypothetical protein